jgi:hypothetical protein
MDRPPSYETAPAYSPPVEERTIPSPAEYSATTASAPEPSRRRSSIREPAPFGRENMPVPPSATSPSAPVVSSSGSEEPAAPKRGWWGKRLLGDKD